MRARFIYETFNLDSDPIADLGIGQRFLIKKFFDKYGISPNEYTIDNNLNIFFKENLNLSDTNITSLPDNLKVGGSLHLYGCTSLTSLPDNLKVNGTLDLEGCTSLTSLPDNLSVNEDLNLWGCTNLTSLPKNLSVEWNLDIRKTKIKSLPKDLKVDREIYKDF